VEPPETKAWKGIEDASNMAGMAAARAVEEGSGEVSMLYILKAAEMAPLALMALSLLVLDPTTKFHVVSYQIESGNPMRTFALLRGVAPARPGMRLSVAGRI